MNKQKFLKRTAYDFPSWRHAAHLTSADVAMITGYSPQTIIQFENGRNNNMFLYIFYRDFLKTIAIYKSDNGFIYNSAYYENFATMYELPTFIKTKEEHNYDY